MASLNINIVNLRPGVVRFLPSGYGTPSCAANRMRLNIVNLRPGVELGSIWKMPILYPDSVYSMSGRLGYSNKWFIAVYIACETTFRNPCVRCVVHCGVYCTGADSCGPRVHSFIYLLETLVPHQFAVVSSPILAGLEYIHSFTC